MMRNDAEASSRDKQRDRDGPAFECVSKQGNMQSVPGTTFAAAYRLVFFESYAVHKIAM